MNWDGVCAYRSSLLGGTNPFADDNPFVDNPWSDRGGAVLDDSTLTVDQIRQQQQQIIARVYWCLLTVL